MYKYAEILGSRIQKGCNLIDDKKMVTQTD